MRKNYISPEFEQVNVYGTYNMGEQTSFNSKLMNLPKRIEISNQELVWYQNTQSEQININIENLLEPSAYSFITILNENHTLTSNQRLNVPKFIIDIQTNDVISKYIFGNLKANRVFEGVTNDFVKVKNVDFSIREYITRNIRSMYFFDKIELYVKYIKINQDGVLKNDYGFSGTTTVNGRVTTVPNDILNEDHLHKNIQIDIDYDQNNIKVIFSPKNDINLFCFDYFFKLYFKRT